MTLSRPASRLVLVGAILCAMLGPVGVPGAAAAPEGTLTIAMHFSVLHEQVTQVPIYHLGFPIGVGPRVDDIMATAPPGFYMSPYEDLKLRAR